MPRNDNFFMFLNNSLDEFVDDMNHIFEAEDNLKAYLAANPNIAMSAAFKKFVDAFSKLAAIIVPMKKQVAKIVDIRKRIDSLKNPMVGWNTIYDITNRMSSKLILLKRQLDTCSDHLDKAKVLIRDLTPEEAEPITVEMSIMALTIPDVIAALKDVNKLLLHLKASPVR